MSRKSPESNKVYKTNWLIIVILLGFSILLFEGCKVKPLSHEYVSLENGVWKVTDTCTFYVNIQNIDTEYDIHFYLRHTNSYPFSNCWLFVDRTAPDHSVLSDTIECEVADNFGKWKASNIGSVMTLPIAYQTAYHFSQRGEYQFRIRHGMRTETLEGVQAIGIKVDAHGEK